MKIIRNALTKSTLSKIHEDAEQKTFGYCWSLNLLTWQDKLLVGTHGGVVQCPVSDSVCELIRNELLIEFPNCSNIHFHHYIWNVGSGIAMHDDAKYAFGATLYLCDLKIDDGGLFIWENAQDDYRVLVPSYNTLVINDNKTNHMVTPVSFDTSVVRQTIQIWGDP